MIMNPANQPPAIPYSPENALQTLITNIPAIAAPKIVPTCFIKNLLLQYYFLGRKKTTKKSYSY
jgi:hypothetical protein